MSNYKRNTSNLDPERGDKFTFKRSIIVPLYEPFFPKETRRDILDIVFRWYAAKQGETVPHLKDPIADAYAQSLIKGQMAAVEEYIKKCDGSRDNRLGKTKSKGNARQPSSTKVNEGQQYNNNDNDNDNGNDNINHCQVSLSGEGSPQVVATPAATPPSIEDAQQWLDEYAPPCTSNDEFYSDDERRTPKGTWPHVYLRANAEDAAEMFLEKLPKIEDSLAECFLNHTLEEMQLGEGTIRIGGENLTHNEVYKRVMLRAYCEDAPDEDDAKGQIYAFRRIFQAVKKCRQMIDVIAGLSDNATSGEDY